MVHNGWRRKKVLPDSRDLLHEAQIMPGSRLVSTPPPPAISTPPLCASSREGLEWPYTIRGGGGHPPSWTAKTKVTIVGNNKIYKRENLVGPPLEHTFGSQTKGGGVSKIGYPD